MKALYNYDDVDKNRVSFAEILKDLNSNMPEGQSLESGGVLRFTRGTKDTDPKWQSRFEVGGDPKQEGLVESQKAAIETIKRSIDRDLGPGAGDRVFGSLGLSDATSISGSDLQRMGSEVRNIQNQMVRSVSDMNRPAVKRWESAAKSDKDSENVATNLTVEELLNHPQATWKMAGSGGTGAIIVTLPGNKGAVIKIEESETTDKTVKIAGLMEATLPQGRNGFNVPTTESLGNLANHGPTVTQLINKLEGFKEGFKDNPTMTRHLERHIKNLTENVGLHSVSKMEFVPGQQLNHLPLDDRVALLQTGTLAREIGRAAVWAPMVGLNDHVTLLKEGGKTNLSNFMIDPSNGKLSPIDLDAENHGTKEAPFYSAFGVKEGLNNLVDFTKNSTASSEELELAIQQMIADQGPKMEPKTPLSVTLQTLTLAEGGEGLFSTAEVRILKEVLGAPELKEKLALEAMRGAVAGLKELSQNQETLKQAFSSQKHGMKPEDVAEVSQSLEGIDFEKIERQLDTYEQQMNLRHQQAAQQKRDLPGVEARKPVQPELDKLAKQQQKLDRLENRPAAGDKLKAFFTRGGMEKLKAEVRTEIEKTKLDILAKTEPEQLKARVDQNQSELSQLKNGQLNGESTKHAVKQAEKVAAHGEKHMSVREALGNSDPKSKKAQVTVHHKL